MCVTCCHLLHENRDFKLWPCYYFNEWSWAQFVPILGLGVLSIKWRVWATGAVRTHSAQYIGRMTSFRHTFWFLLVKPLRSYLSENLQLLRYLRKSLVLQEIAIIISKVVVSFYISCLSNLNPRNLVKIKENICPRTDKQNIHSSMFITTPNWKGLRRIQ